MASSDILPEIKKIFKAKWQERDGRKVPDTESLTLGNDAIKLDGTVLYADMTDSTGLVNQYKASFAAEVYKAYLIGACRVISEEGGEITAFDGDRVMAVFLGNSKNTSAARSALKLNFLVIEINKLIKQEYPNTSYSLVQTVGIDTSKLFVAKTGIRSANDLVWVGKSANYAAKLCSLGDSTYPTYITSEVFDLLHVNTKNGGNPRVSMWEKIIWQEFGIPVYRSSWFWRF